MEVSTEPVYDVEGNGTINVPTLTITNPAGKPISEYDSLDLYISKITMPDGVELATPFTNEIKIEPSQSHSEPLKVTDEIQKKIDAGNLTQAIDMGKVKIEFVYDTTSVKNAIAITGTTKVNKQLTANINGTFPTTANLKYTWYRLNTADNETGREITQTNSEKYTPQNSDIAKYIKVVVTASSGLYRWSATATTAKIETEEFAFLDESNMLHIYKRSKSGATAGQTFDGNKVKTLYDVRLEENTYTDSTVPWQSVRAQIKKVWVHNDIKPISTDFWFKNLSACESFTINKITGENLQSAQSMFYGCKKATAIDVNSGLITNTTTNMNSMFYLCEKLTAITGAQSWDTSKVIDMGSIFYDCKELIKLNLSGWNTSSVTADMKLMFNNCKKLSEITFGPEWSFKGTHTDSSKYAVLPTPSTTDITGADGKRYRTNTDDGKSADDLRDQWTSDLAGTWYANKSLTPEHDTGTDSNPTVSARK